MNDMALRPEPPTRNILSLCAGVGGLELGILLALHHRGEAGRGVCYVEREAAAAASLVASMEAGWFHPAPVWSDMLTFDARPWRGRVHILASGDPCQDNSVAGKGAGAGGARFLAPEVVRIAEGCRPDVIFRENVPGNAHGQLRAIVPALEGLGYRVAAGIFSSAETGNSMRRERLFILVKRVESAGGGRHGDADEEIRPRWHGVEPGGDDMACREGGGFGERGQEDRQGCGRHADGGCLTLSPRQEGAGGIGSANQVLRAAIIPGPGSAAWPGLLERHPELRPALSEAEAESLLRGGIDALAERVERLRACGNGVDPVVAAYAFLALDALHQRDQANGRTDIILKEQVA